MAEKKVRVRASSECLIMRCYAKLLSRSEFHAARLSSARSQRGRLLQPRLASSSKSVSAQARPRVAPRARPLSPPTQAIIKNADMSEEMQHACIDCAAQAMERFNIEKDIAAYIKKEFDKKYGPTWHVIVGRNFGSYVTHETKHFIYFYLGQVAVLAFKSG